MVILKNWQPLNLPRGSVRAIVSLLLLGTFWTQMLRGASIPPVFVALVLFVLGYYFGSRTRSSRATEGPPEKAPLFLPRGTIRIITVVGFVAVGTLLWRDGRLAVSPPDTNCVILVLVGGMTFGAAVGKLANLLAPSDTSGPRRWYENSKAVLVVIAAILLVLGSFFAKPEQDLAIFHRLLISLVSFYFGSR